jgi:HPt (histidine-containing phosphotransfer) domain-containing protein
MEMTAGHVHGEDQDSSPEPSAGDTVPTDPIDAVTWAGLLELMGADGTDVMAELIDSYLEDTTGRLAEIRAAHRSGDAMRLRRSAHALRSPSASLGAWAVAGLCAEVEEGLRHGSGAVNWPEVRIDRLMAEAERAMAALKARHPHHGIQH